MTVLILKPGTPKVRVATCPACGCEFSFHPADMKHDFDVGPGPGSYSIPCPQTDPTTGQRLCNEWIELGPCVRGRNDIA